MADKPTDILEEAAKELIQDPHALLRALNVVQIVLGRTELAAALKRAGKRLLPTRECHLCEDESLRTLDLTKTITILSELEEWAKGNRGTLQDVLAPEGKGMFDLRKALDKHFQNTEIAGFETFVLSLRLFALENNLNFVMLPLGSSKAGSFAPADSSAKRFTLAGKTYFVVIVEDNLRVYEAVDESTWLLAEDTVTLPVIAERVQQAHLLDETSLREFLGKVAISFGLYLKPARRAGEEFEFLRLDATPGSGDVKITIADGEYVLRLRGRQITLLVLPRSS